MKDLAILIPAYNDGAALVRTLDSISEADSSFTVVVVDDGSDEPVSIDPGRYPFAVQVLRREKNSGIVGALNAGLETVRSQGFAYVARLDAADLNRPGRFQIQYDRLRSDDCLAMVGANAVFREEESGEVLFTTILPLSCPEIRRWMVFRNCFIHPTVMFRAEILRQVGFYDARYPHIEDYEFFSRIAERFLCENIEEPLVDCFVREQGISGRNQRRQLISGLKFKLSHPRPFNPLWYAVLLKRASYLVMPFALRTRLKHLLGFVAAARGDGEDAPGGEKSGALDHS